MQQKKCHEPSASLHVEYERKETTYNLDTLEYNGVDKDRFSRAKLGILKEDVLQ